MSGVESVREGGGELPGSAARCAHGTCVVVDVFGLTVAVDPGLDVGDAARLRDGMRAYAEPAGNGVDWRRVDAVLASHPQGLLALPYVTEYRGFRGGVYATRPVLDAAKVAMRSLVSLAEAAATPAAAALAPHAYALCDVEAALGRVVEVECHEVFELGGGGGGGGGVVRAAACPAAGGCDGAVAWSVEQAGAGALLVVSGGAPLPEAEAKIGWGFGCVLAPFALAAGEVGYDVAQVAQFVKSAIAGDRHVLVPGCVYGLGGGLGALHVSRDLLRVLSGGVGSSGRGGGGGGGGGGGVPAIVVVSEKEKDLKEVGGRVSEFLTDATLRRELAMSLPDRPFHKQTALVSCDALAAPSSVAARGAACFVLADPAALELSQAVSTLTGRAASSATYACGGAPAVVPAALLSPHVPAASLAALAERLGAGSVVSSLPAGGAPATFSVATTTTTTRTTSQQQQPGERSTPVPQVQGFVPHAALAKSLANPAASGRLRVLPGRSGGGGGSTLYCPVGECTLVRRDGGCTLLPVGEGGGGRGSGVGRRLYWAAGRPLPGTALKDAARRAREIRQREVCEGKYMYLTKREKRELAKTAAGAAAAPATAEEAQAAAAAAEESVTLKGGGGDDFTAELPQLRCSLTHAAKRRRTEVVCTGSTGDITALTGVLEMALYPV